MADVQHDVRFTLTADKSICQPGVDSGDYGRTHSSESTKGCPQAEIGED